MDQRNSLRFPNLANNSFIKCFKSPIVVGTDFNELAINKSNIENEEMLPMV
jgi:hypothetical protein